MPLCSRSADHNVFFEAPALLLDTCAITWFAKEEGGVALFDKAMAHYQFLVPTPVLYELAFGLPEKVDINERLLRDRLSDFRTHVDLFAYGRAREKAKFELGDA